MTIIVRFVKNNVLCLRDIDIYEFWGGMWGHAWSTVHILFITKKNEKVQEHDIYPHLFCIKCV